MTCALALCLIAGSFSAIDGDTIRAGDLHLRLWGIDAPELSHPSGAAARQALISLIAGQDLSCERKGHDHGRLVARCVRDDGQDLACLMVAAGQAADWPRYSGGAYAPCAP